MVGVSLYKHRYITYVRDCGGGAGRHSLIRERAEAVPPKPQDPKIKQTQNGWILIGDTPKDSATLQSEHKIQHFEKRNGVTPKVFSPCKRHKGKKALVLEGILNTVKIDFKELLDFNKITHAVAEQMKRKRSSRDLPLINIKCDDP